MTQINDPGYFKSREEAAREAMFNAYAQEKAMDRVGEVVGSYPNNANAQMQSQGQAINGAGCREKVQSLMRRDARKMRERAAQLDKIADATDHLSVEFECAFYEVYTSKRLAF